MTNFGHVFLQVTVSLSRRLLLDRLLVVVEKVDRALFHIIPLVIIADNHSDVLVAGHHLHLAVAEAEADRPGDGRAAQIVRREPQPPLLLLPPLPDFVLAGFILVCDLVESRKIGPPIDDFTDLTSREGLREFERAIVDEGLEDEGLLAITLRVAPSLGVQFQVMVDSLLDLLRQRDGPLAASLDTNAQGPATMTPIDRGSPQVMDLADSQTCPCHQEQERVVASSVRVAPVGGQDQSIDLGRSEHTPRHILGNLREADEPGVGRIYLYHPCGLQIAEIRSDDRNPGRDGTCFALHTAQVVAV
jgi:hypothetical protein